VKVCYASYTMGFGSTYVAYDKFNVEFQPMVPEGEASLFVIEGFMTTSGVQARLQVGGVPCVCNHAHH